MSLYLPPRPLATLDTAWAPDGVGSQTELTFGGKPRRLTSGGLLRDRLIQYYLAFCDSAGVVVPDAGTFSVQALRIDLAADTPVIVRAVADVAAANALQLYTIAGAHEGTYDIRITGVTPSGAPTHYKVHAWIE